MQRYVADERFRLPNKLTGLHEYAELDLLQAFLKSSDADCKAPKDPGNPNFSWKNAASLVLRRMLQTFQTWSD